MHGPRPCLRPGGFVLRALFVGLCALVLLTQAAAAANQERPATAQKQGAKASSTEKDRARVLQRKLALKLEAARRHRSTIRFFKTHRWLVRSNEHRAAAHLALRRAHRGLARVTKEIAHYRRLVRQSEDHLRARRLKAAQPRRAICGVFGQYCQQAISVAWCESRLSPAARNGQYLGLFQMGSSERRLFGHGRSPYEQAVAAHRYFVHSGQDWSPWSCRWAAY